MSGLLSNKENIVIDYELKDLDLSRFKKINSWAIRIDVHPDRVGPILRAAITKLDSCAVKYSDIYEIIADSFYQKMYNRESIEWSESEIEELANRFSFGNDNDFAFAIRKSLWDFIGDLIDIISGSYWACGYRSGDIMSKAHIHVSKRRDFDILILDFLRPKGVRHDKKHNNDTGEH